MPAAICVSTASQHSSQKDTVTGSRGSVCCHSGCTIRALAAAAAAVVDIVVVVRAPETRRRRFDGAAVLARYIRDEWCSVC